MELDELRFAARSVVEDPRLTFHQRRARLAALAEDSLAYPALSDACAEALDKRIICDMYEGAAPYRPHYLLPDYARALKYGSTFLQLPAPTSLTDALWFLTAMYSQVPSITGYPVFLGNLDRDLAPFTEGMTEDELVTVLRPFWRALDRLLPDAFVHVNLGPDDSPVTRAVFRLERELLQVVPNVTLQVDPARTPDELILDGVKTVFACGKPHFVNHPMMVTDLGDRYAAVSCYNSLPVGGGAHTLVRLNLFEVVRQHSGPLEAFFDTTLPRYVELACQLIEARVRYLVEEVRFFGHDWLVREGLLDPERFSAMFGVFGLAEAVNALMEYEHTDGTYGHDAVANELAYLITRNVAQRVANRSIPHCAGNGGVCFLHAQSGIDSDIGVTAGVRIPIGEEPSLPAHLATVARHHHLFQAGVSDILHFDETAVRNPGAIVDIIRGGFRSGMRDMTFNLDSNDFIRITGYLVRKSDLERIDEGARHGSTFLGAGSEQEARCTTRSPKRVVSHERSPRPTG